jgi:hypothetical protein
MLMTMRSVRGPVIVGAFIVTMVGSLSGQTSKPPISNPSIVAPPTWWRAIPMADGRVFVTDGGLSIDAAVVKPATLPEKFPAAAGANVARLLSSPYDKETGLGDLRPGTRPNTFVTAEGVVLNGNYITLLRSVLTPARTRLRTKGKTDPVVVVVDGGAVGVMMPVQPPREK